ncbi:hypothetical protein AAHE18_12G163800 [Arachis hypogaea]
MVIYFINDIPIYIDPIHIFFLLPFFFSFKLFMDNTPEALLPSYLLVIFTTLDIPFLAAARCCGRRLIIFLSSGQYAYGSSLSFLFTSPLAFLLAYSFPV